MPLHHDKREILFHKFILIRDDVLESYSHVESDLKSKLISFIDEDCINDVHVEIIDSGLEPFLGITAVFSPSLGISSNNFIEKYKDDISSLFDLHKEAKEGVFENSETENILKFHGELYFEGDSPWGIKKVK
jgi:hypothetical protein